MDALPGSRVIVNGAMQPADQAGFPVFHQSLVDSFGIYETIKFEKGRFFHLSWHMERLGQSAEILGLDLPAPVEEIAEWSRRLAATWHGTDGMLRIVAYGSDGVNPAVCGLYYKPPIIHPERFYKAGAWAISSEGERTWPLAKSTNCLAQTMARRKAGSLGAQEGLIVDRHGNITEGSTSNILAVRDGVLLRPLEGTALAGVTEGIVLQLAQDLAIPVQHTTLPLNEVPTWDEAFITSTNRRALPLRQIDDVLLPTCPGPVTGQLMAGYLDYEAQHGWER
ncbi:MAG: aminotransferase class IV [Chloroflexota bacterium]|nr:aminotransferase class IV [Chloroflexota bacterium]